MTKVRVRKPNVIIVGIPQEIARVLQPVKETLEILTGATRGSSEIKGLRKSSTNEEIINKVNELIRRLNASGGDHV